MKNVVWPFLLACLLIPHTGNAETSEIYGPINVIDGYTRLDYDIKNSPIPLTIIDRKTIQATGYKDITDIFRIVPGMLPSYYASSLPILARHGSSSYINNDILVMLDGKPFYIPFLHKVSWQQLPINIDEIERIEIARGPNSSIYGSSAFKASINIITRKSFQDDKASVKITTGTGNTQISHFRANSSLGEWDTRVSTTFENGQGFEEIDDYYKTRKLFIKSEKNSAHDAYLVQAGISQANNFIGTEKSFNELIHPAHDYYSREYFVHLKARHNLSQGENINLQFSYTNNKEADKYQTALLSEILGVLPSDIPTIFPGQPDQQIKLGYMNGNAKTTHAEIYYHNKTDRQLEFNLGLSANRQETRSHTWYGHDDWIQENLYQASGQVVYKPDRHNTFNASYLAEQSDDSKAYGSYRLAYNLKPTMNHTFRLSHARAHKLPDHISRNGYNAVYFANGEVIDLLYLGNKDIVPEEVKTNEISYIYTPSRKFISEITYFENHYDKHMYSKSTDIPITPIDTDPGYSVISNTGAYSVYGIEAQLKYSGENFFIQGHYTELKAEGKTSRSVDNTLYYDHSEITPQHIIGATMGLYLGDYTISTNLFYHDSFEWLSVGDEGDPFWRKDFVVSKKSFMGNKNIQIDLVAQNLGGDYFEYLDTNWFGKRYYLTLRMKL